MDLSLKTRLALWWNRPGKHTFTPLALALREQKQVFSNLLVLLPTAPEQSRSAHMFIQSLQNTIGPSAKLHVRYVAKRRNLEYFDSQINDRLITYSKDHLNRWGLPEQSLLEIIITSPPEVVVDLNVGFDPVSVMITKYSRAPLRIGFYHEDSERYYNILIKHGQNRFINEGYSKIQQLLGLS